MQITEIRLRKVLNGVRLKAVATVTFDNVFVIHGIKVIEGEGGLFMAMPSRKMPDGTYKDIVHPIENSLRNVLQEAVLREYQIAEANGNAESIEEAV